MEGLRHGSRSVSNLVAEYRQGPTAEQWLQIKGVVQELYCENKRPLKEVKAILARDYNFRATYDLHPEPVGCYRG
jgi:Clr5 domain